MAQRPAPVAGRRGLRGHARPRWISPLRRANRPPPGAAGRGGSLSRAPSALWPGPPAPPSHALRPVTTGNAFSAMSYRNCWHIFGPRLKGWLLRLPPPRLARGTAPGAETLDRALAQWLRFLTAADGGASSDPRWLADRTAQLRIVGCRALLILRERTPQRRRLDCLLARLHGPAPHVLRTPRPRWPRSGPPPDSHVSGARRAFAPNHSQIYPMLGLASRL